VPEHKLKGNSSFMFSEATYMNGEKTPWYRDNKIKEAMTLRLVR